MAEVLTPYAEIIGVLDNLPLILRETRRRLGVGQREAGRQMGMSFSTVSRIEAGHDCALSHAVAVLRWAATN